MRELIFVFIGSALGGVARYGIGKWINSIYFSKFPFGTFTVNILACFILGFVIGLAETRQVVSPQTKIFWVVGFCGGFSTFSTFSYESLQLFQNGNHLVNLLYISLSTLFCLVFTYLGLTIAGKV